MTQLKVKSEVLEVEPFVREAARALGYVREDCVEWLAKEIAKYFFHGKADYHIRREGEQLTKDEKKALGLDPYTHLSQKVFDCLTEKGLRDPLENFRTTCSRITKNLFREAERRKLARMANKKFKVFKHVQFRTGPREPCAAARKLADRIFPIGQQPDLPLKDCDREVCSCWYLLHHERKRKPD